MSSENIKEVLNSSEFVVLFAGADWCGYCKKMTPIFNEVAQEHGSLYKFTKVDIQIEVDFPKEHKINGFPTMLYMRNGVEIGREVGYMSKEAFTATISKHFNK